VEEHFLCPRDTRHTPPESTVGGDARATGVRISRRKSLTRSGLFRASDAHSTTEPAELRPRATTTSDPAADGDATSAPAETDNVVLTPSSGLAIAQSVGFGPCGVAPEALRARQSVTACPHGSATSCPLRGWTAGFTMASLRSAAPLPLHCRNGRLCASGDLCQ
jgi:hypothetical protein